MPATSDTQRKTKSSLLARLKDWQDKDSWQVFFDTYWSLIYGTAVKSGLTVSEAEDVVQDTVVTVAKKIKDFQYDRAKGSFRGWLGTIIRSRVVDLKRKRLPVKPPSIRALGEASRTSTTRRIPDPAPVDFYTVYDLAWREYLCEKALELLKEELSPKQYAIFDLSVNKGRPVPEIMKTLGVSRPQVYMAKLRGLQTLKQKVKQVEKLSEQGVF
jgi:RNA polymerase sigma-70 factor (ECF subfamily)